jgi:hypothetical protein
VRLCLLLINLNQSINRYQSKQRLFKIIQNLKTVRPRLNEIKQLAERVNLKKTHTTHTRTHTRTHTHTTFDVFVCILFLYCGMCICFYCFEKSEARRHPHRQGSFLKNAQSAMLIGCVKSGSLLRSRVDRALRPIDTEQNYERENAW